MPVDVAHLLSPEGAIARRLSGFESRPQQIEMAAAVEHALASKSRLIVEAGTGVGKSFAYLLPAIKRIVENRERVIVVTNTINLQEQLIEKDIPLLNAVIPEEFSAVLVKGRGNYVSLRRLKLASERQDKLFMDDDARHSLHMLEEWAYSTRDGTLSSLPQLPRMDVWDYAQSDTHNCMGKKCESYEKCFYQTARRRMEHGDLLVCNHALFFADLALRAGGAGMLPQYQHVILDEAHCVEEVAAGHFGLSLGEGRIRHLLSLLYQPRTQKGFLTTLKLKNESTELIDETISLTHRCRNMADKLFADLSHWQEERGPGNGRMNEPGVVENEVTPVMKKLGAHLRLLKERAAKEADAYELNSYALRADSIGFDAGILIDQRLEGCVYWLEGGEGNPSQRRQTRRRAQGGSRKNPQRLTLNAAAVDVAPKLREHLFGKDIGIVLTSATLATGPNNFNHLKQRLGCEGSPSLHLGSPFDHAAQMRVIIDRAMPEPSHPRYVERLVPRIEQLIRQTDGGAFVLFTSFEMLSKAAAALRPLLIEHSYPVLVQGEDGPPGLLLKRFRNDERSVLLGTNSFWQGVDVRGRGLRNVIITRLPFEVPDRPLIEARHELIRERGGNPFTDDQLPRAIIRFKQGVGRLIRSTTDTGQVAVLDPRIATKNYGRAFIEALPEGVMIDEAAMVFDACD